MSTFQSQSDLSWLQKSALDDFGVTEAELYQPPKPDPNAPKVDPSGQLSMGEGATKNIDRMLGAAHKAFVRDFIANQAYLQQRAINAVGPRILSRGMQAVGLIPDGEAAQAVATSVMPMSAKKGMEITAQDAAISEEDRGVMSFLGSIVGGVGQFAVSPSAAITQMAVSGHRSTFQETGSDSAAMGTAIINGVMGVLGLRLARAGGKITVASKTASGTTTTTVRGTTQQVLNRIAMQGGTKAAVVAALKRTTRDTAVMGLVAEAAIVADEVQKGVWTDATTESIINRIIERSPEAIAGALTQSALTGYGQARGVFGAVKARGILREAIDTVGDALINDKHPIHNRPLTPNERFQYEQAMGNYARTAKEQGWADLGGKVKFGAEPNPAREAHISRQLEAARIATKTEAAKPPPKPSKDKPAPAAEGEAPAKPEPKAVEKPKPKPEPIEQVDGTIVKPITPTVVKFSEADLAVASPEDLRAAALNFDIFATGNETGEQRQAVVAKILEAQERRTELMEMVEEAAAIDAKQQADLVAADDGLDPNTTITIETPEESITMTVDEAKARLAEIDASRAAEEGGANEGALASAEAKAIRDALKTAAESTTVDTPPTSLTPEQEAQIAAAPPMVRERMRQEMMEAAAPKFDDLPQAMKDELYNAGLMGKTGAGDVRDFFDSLPGNERAAHLAEWQDESAKMGARAAPEPTPLPTAQPQPAAPQPADILKKSGLTITKSKTTSGKDVWEVTGDTFPYKAAMKELGGRWYGPKKAWSFYGEDPTNKLAERLANERSNTDVGLPDPGVAVSAPRTVDRPSPVRTGSPPTDERIVTARWEFTPEQDTSVIPADVAQHLRPHQAAATAMAWNAMHADDRGAIIASGTGAGKTRSILAVAKMHMDGEKRPVVVIAPNEVFGKPFANKGIVSGSYANDAKAMGIDYTLTKGEHKIEDGKLYYTTYDHFGKLKYPSNAVLVFDEAHALKNAKATGSKRGVAGIDIIDGAHSVLFATATPADKAIHIPYMRRAGVYEGRTATEQIERLGMREVVKFDDRTKKTTRFWMPQNGVTSEEILSRLDDLFIRLTAAGKMIKHEISFKGLNVHITRLKLPPEAHQTMADIEAAFGGGQGLKQALNWMHQRRQQEPYKVQAAADAFEASVKAGRMPIVFLARVNFSKAELKVYGENMMGEREVVDIINVAESEGTVKLLKEELAKRGITKIAELHGNSDTTAAEAMRQVQSGEAEGLIATMQSGGTGINLDDIVGNRPRDMIIITPPFSSVEFVQGLGRVWRLTTKSNPTFQVLLGDTLVDDWNAKIITEKMNTLGAAVSGEVGAMKMGERPAIEPPQPAAPAPTAPPAVSQGTANQDSIAARQAGIRAIAQAMPPEARGMEIKAIPQRDIGANNQLIPWDGKTFEAAFSDEHRPDVLEKIRERMASEGFSPSDVRRDPISGIYHLSVRDIKEPDSGILDQSQAQGGISSPGGMPVSSLLAPQSAMGAAAAPKPKSLPDSTLTPQYIKAMRPHAIKREADARGLKYKSVEQAQEALLGYIAAKNPTAVEPDVAPKQPWEMTRTEYVGEYQEPYSVKDIQEATKKASSARRRHNARTGAMVPPAISGEISAKISKQETTADGMREAYRAYVDAYKRGIEDHYEAVKRAIAQGRPVPPEVLADYPDLARSAAAATTGVQSGNEPSPQRPSTDVEAPDSGQQAPTEPAKTEVVARAVPRGAIEKRIVAAYSEHGTAYDQINTTLSNLDAIESDADAGRPSGITSFAVDRDTLSNYGKSGPMRAAKAGIAIVEDATWIRDRFGDEMYFAALDEKLGGKAGKIRAAIASVMREPEMYEPQVVLDAYIASRWPEMNLRQPEELPPDFIGPPRITAGEANMKREFVDPASLKPGDRMFVFGKPFAVGVDRSGDLVLISRAIKAQLPISMLTDIPVDGPVQKGFGASNSEQTTFLKENKDGATIPEGESVGAITGKQGKLDLDQETGPSQLDIETKAMNQHVDDANQRFLDEFDPPHDDLDDFDHGGPYTGSRRGIVLNPFPYILSGARYIGNSALVENLLNGGRFFINTFVRDMIDVVQASETIAGRALGHYAERAVSLQKGAIGKLSGVRDAALRIAGRSVSGAWHAQQIKWESWGGGYAALKTGMEGGFVHPSARKLIAAGQALMDATGKMALTNNLPRYDHATGTWGPFPYIPGGKVFPRLFTDDHVRIMMNGDTALRRELIRILLADPRNVGLTQPGLEALYDSYGDDLRSPTVDAAKRRINAEFSREIKSYPTHMRDPQTGRIIALMDTVPLSYFTRIADNMATRVAYGNVFGYDTDTTSDLSHALIKAYGEQTGDQAPAIALVRTLAGLPVFDPMNISPTSRRFVHNTMQTIGLMRDLMYSGSQPGNLLEVFGTPAAFNSLRDFVVAMRRMSPDVAPAFLAFARRIGSVINEFDNYTYNPNDPFGSIVGALGAVLRNSYKWANIWTEDFVAVLAQTKVDRLRAGKGSKLDAIDLMQTMGWDAARAKRVASGGGLAWEYNAILRRAPTGLLASNQGKPESSKASQHPVYRAATFAERFAQMRLRTVLDAFRMMDQARKSKDRGLFYAGVGRLLKAMGFMTATGLMTQLVTAWLAGGTTGANIFLNELADDPWEVAGEALAYNLLAGPFGGIVRLANDSDDYAEKLVRMTLPGMVFDELYKLTTGGGQYRDLTTGQKVAHYMGRMTPMSKPLAQGLAMLGIGAWDDPITGSSTGLRELDLETASRAYWRWRFEEAPPSSGSDEGDVPTEAEAAAEMANSRAFRFHMKQAYMAWRDGNSPQEHIDEALSVDGKDYGSISQSLRRRMYLIDLTDGQKESLLNRIGVDAYSMLEDHDTILQGWMSSGSP